MIINNSPGERIFSIVNYILLVFIALICFYPMWHALMGSISEPESLSRHMGPLLWPVGYSLKAFEVVFANPNIKTGYLNTLLYVVTGTAINITLTCLGGYALSRRNFMFKKTITLGIVFTMYFSGGIVPNFLLVQALGIYNTMFAIILPGAVWTFQLIVMRTAFKAVPESLEESAKLDGASDFVILFHIFIPVAKATIAVLLLFFTVGHWNSWITAMLYLRDRSKYPLQIFLREILISNSAGGNVAVDYSGNMPHMAESIKYCSIIVATVPILCVYPFVQKYFVRGVMLGSVKE